MAALLLSWGKRWPVRLLALGYFPLGLGAVLLTASRGGFIAVIVALCGCCFLLIREQRRVVLGGLFALPMVGVVLWFVAPHETLERISTIAEQLRSGNLNERLNIWAAGWRAFVQAPFVGHGAGCFVSAAGLAPMDTAHNTALSILVEGGICAFILSFGILVWSVYAAWQTHGPLRIAMMTLLLVWIISSLVGTVGESRTTWLLLAMISLAGRLSKEEPGQHEGQSVLVEVLGGAV